MGSVDWTCLYGHMVPLHLWPITWTAVKCDCWVVEYCAYLDYNVPLFLSKRVVHTHDRNTTSMLSLPSHPAMLRWWDVCGLFRGARQMHRVGISHTKEPQQYIDAILYRHTTKRGRCAYNNKRITRPTIAVLAYPCSGMGTTTYTHEEPGAPLLHSLKRQAGCDLNTCAEKGEDPSGSSEGGGRCPGKVLYLISKPLPVLDG